MSKTWKWILGVALALVILVGVGFFAASYFGFGHMSLWGGTFPYGHPMMDGYGFEGRGPLGNGQNFRHPMMGGRWFGGYGFFSAPFFFLGWFLRLLLPFAILAGVAYFSYQQGKKAGIRAAQVSAVPEPKEE